MAVTRFRTLGRLDRFRISRGNEAYIEAFAQLCMRNRAGALALLNDRLLRFPSFFLVLPEIESQGLGDRLNLRNETAQGIVLQITGQDTGGTDYLAAESGTVLPVLQWILQTGYDENDMGDDYEQVLDIAVSVLLNVYRDRDTLPIAIDLIFRRGLQNRYIHDLAWAIFRIREPEALRLIARHLRSSNPAETTLAGELLGIEAQGDGTLGARQTFDSYIRWLSENEPFLYFTGESHQYTTQPTFIRIDLERKYLQKAVLSREHQPVLPAEDEYEKLQDFQALGAAERTVLSGYSSSLRKRDVSAWESWMRLPINEQILSAVGNGEDAQ